MNQYPHTSHSFIRREINAVEQAGVVVERFSIRRSATTLVDPGDQAEQAKTTCLLEAGGLSLLMASLTTFLSNPAGSLMALAECIRIGRKSERGVLRHLIYLAEAALLLKHVKARSVQHLHAHFGTNPATVALLCRMLGGPTFSVTIHGPEEFDSPRGLSLASKIAQASFVAAISEFTRSQLFRWIPYNQWPSIHVVRCGVSEVFLTQPETPVPDEPRLVCVGRLCEQKGQLNLVRAAARLKEEGLAFQLTLIGDGDMRPAIEELIRTHSLQQHVVIAGWKGEADVRAEILRSRALVLPSFAEGLPVVLMESLALGRPAISTYIAGIPELIIPHENGWLVPAGAVEPLCDAMREALTAPSEQLTQWGLNGKQRVGQQQNVMLEGKKLADLFTKAVSSAPMAT